MIGSIVSSVHAQGYAIPDLQKDRKDKVEDDRMTMSSMVGPGSVSWAEGVSGLVGSS